MHLFLAESNAAQQDNNSKSASLATTLLSKNSFAFNQCIYIHTLAWISQFARRLDAEMRVKIELCVLLELD